MPSPTSRLCLVRHGETDWNAGRRIQGQIDPLLNANGIAQARAAAEALARQRLAAIYSSDLLRARHTAEIIAARHHLSVRLSSALRERHCGILQGLTYAEAELRYPDSYARFARRHLDERLDHGESLREFGARVSGALHAIAEAHPGEHVLVVAHGGVLDIAYRLATQRALEAARDFTISNAGLSWIAFSPQGWRLLSWNTSPQALNGLDELPG